VYSSESQQPTYIRKAVARLRSCGTARHRGFVGRWQAKSWK